MSCVGPRPALTTQISLLQARAQTKVLGLRPGFTGLAQINSFDGMTELDKVLWEARYAERVSLKSDVVIILKTFTYLLRPPPVY